MSGLSSFPLWLASTPSMAVHKESILDINQSGWNIPIIGLASCTGESSPLSASFAEAVSKELFADEPGNPIISMNFY
jgi:hypothetical protein